MAEQVTYTAARANLAALCSRVAEDREVVLITRRGSETVALISAEELNSLQETAYLLRSPRNAQRLLSALSRALKRRGRGQTVEQLKRELGIAPSKPRRKQ